MGKSRQTGIAFLEKDEKRGKPGDKGRELVLGDLRAASEEQTAHAGVSPHQGRRACLPVPSSSTACTKAGQGAATHTLRRDSG